MKDVVLEEKIDKIITEELGIANGVVALADKIEKIIYQLINNGVESREFSINTDFSTVNVNFTHKDFYNQNEAEKWMTSEAINKYSQTENTIYISVASVNGDVDFYSLADEIQHECYHYFETSKWKKEPFDENIIIKGIRSGNKSLSVICSILYFSIEDEIDAFVNGAYASSMKKKANYENYKDFIYDNKISDIYYFLSNAKFLLDEIKGPLYQTALMWVSTNILGCGIDEAPDLILRIAETAYQYFIKRVGKVYSLYVKNMKEYNDKKEEDKIRNILKNGDV